MLSIMAANGLTESGECLDILGVDTQILSNKTPLSDLRKVDGLILSGGAARVGLTGQLGNCAEYLTLDIPILRDMCGPSIHGRVLWRQITRSP